MVEPITGKQLSYLLYKVSVAERRSFSDEEGSLWLNLLSDYSYDQCYEAFNEYLANQSAEFLTPSLIIKIIKAKKRLRIQQKLGTQKPPNGIRGKEYLAWLETAAESISQPPKAPSAPDAQEELSASNIRSIES